MENEIIKNYYKVKDLYIVSLLLCLNFNFKQTERVGDVLFFYFDCKEDCEKIVSDYYNRNIKIEPLKYVESMKVAKNLIYK